MAKRKLVRAVIADDEGHIRIYLRNILEQMNIEVVGEASDGEEAVTLYKEEKPHLIFLDINMPVKTGEDALKEIIDFDPNARAIMLTAAFNRETVERIIEIGAANFIRKDTSIGEMKKIIKETWDMFRKSGKKNHA